MTTITDKIRLQRYHIAHQIIDNSTPISTTLSSGHTIFAFSHPSRIIHAKVNTFIIQFTAACIKDTIGESIRNINENSKYSSTIYGL